MFNICDIVRVRNLPLLNKKIRGSEGIITDFLPDDSLYKVLFEGKGFYLFKYEELELVETFKKWGQKCVN